MKNRWMKLVKSKAFHHRCFSLCWSTAVGSVRSPLSAPTSSKPSLPSSVWPTSWLPPLRWLSACLTYLTSLVCQGQLVIRFNHSFWSIHIIYKSHKSRMISLNLALNEPAPDTSVEQKQYKVQTKQGIELQFNDMKHYNYFRLGLATQLYLMVGAKTMM